MWFEEQLTRCCEEASHGIHTLTIGWLNPTRPVWRIIVQHTRKTTIYCTGQVIHCIIALQKNGSCPGQSSLYQLFDVRTFHETMPIPPEMQEISKSHHSLLHKDSTTRPSWSMQSSQLSQMQEDPIVTTHTSQSSHQHQVLFMTCQVIAIRLTVLSINLELCLTLAHLPRSSQSN